MLKRAHAEILRTRILAIAGATAFAAAYAACSGGGGSVTNPSGGSTSPSGGLGGAPSSGRSGSSGSTGGDGTGGMASTGVGLFFDAGISADALGPPPPGTECFDWSTEAGACPTDPAVIVFILDEHGCMDGGAATKEPAGVVSGPDPDAGLSEDGAPQCCYVVDYLYCVGGGRPYLEEGAPVLAPPRGLVDVAVDASRGAAEPACRWTRDGLAEHASVASFSRFALGLLAHGAPADLIEEAHAAALDELHHAELCFGLASRAAGAPVAAGSFPAGDVTIPRDLAELAAATVREGCVGEAIAALLAAEELERTTDAPVRAALARIVEDESRHAELAWRTVSWALLAGGAEVRAAVARAFEETTGAELGSLVAPSVAGALREVIKPCAAAVLRATRRG